MKILVAGIGNILRCDDGLGPLLIEQLKKTFCRHNVEFLDLGISGFEILRFLKDCDKVIFIDSIKKGGTPGTAYHIKYQRDNLPLNNNVSNPLTAISYHDVNLKLILESGKRLGFLPQEIVIIGCEPLDTQSLKMGLSKPVEESLPKLTNLILEEIDKK